MPTIHVPEVQDWSGGGSVVMRNFRELVDENPEMFAESEEQITLVMKNIPDRSVLRNRFVYMPQNAWAWNGPTEQLWRPALKLAALRGVSKLMLHRADALIRLSNLIPPSPKSARTLMLPNVLDAQFEIELIQAREKIEEHGGPSKRPYVFVPGSVTTYRNVSAVLFARRLFSDLDILVVGAPLSPTAAEQLCHTADQDSQVSYIANHVDRATIIQLMLGAEVTVFPSLVEASPIGVAEAVALGVPVIASDISPHRHFLSDERLFDTSTPDGGGDELAHLLSERTFNRCLASTKQDRHAERQKWKQSLKDFLEIVRAT